MSDKEEDEVGLPKATVFKLIGELLPKDMTCTKEARDLIVECCVEWIHLLSSTANEKCELSNKKTISPEHVIQALKMLGFEEFIIDVEESNEEFKKSAKERIRKPPDTHGMSPEELLALQQSLFQKSHGRMVDESAIPVGGGEGEVDGDGEVDEEMKEEI
ncbi:hypothetical protein TREMEDRAFT_34512 [Tremella mesenterica DSM 1558]|uniref:uncharacterized protein n=1 Tax=Tremella mesenterica (strain ATCC 24925 / CBS 8224 / DSM 1558 / NBRC 9311 / NRRL Y-6157 / RJB 2259-6 / UBC 559-6) TaxID=578456 RepID=UPI00032B9A24|nr:uncharacterized protein TREMEDRAFT_34512 [Tremella mesenterica DSM 1558]EIW66745.1 hypothetical protein TREMEDRAFT_34512 [Tremella mesenterica DSM 1558]